MNKKEYLSCDEILNACYFVLKKCKEGEIICNNSKTTNYLVFCQTGTVRLTSSLFKEEMLYAGEILFFPCMADCQGEMQQDTCVIIHTFNNTVCRPENCMLAYLYSHRNIPSPTGEIHYSCKLTAHLPLLTFMTSVNYYLEDQSGDFSLWCLKHKELIYLFCHYYSVKELQSFFHPITGKNIPFKNLVLAHYTKVNTTEELAALCGYGLYTFRRKFKKEFDIPVYQWLVKKRAEHILNRLSLSYIPFCDIIEEFNIPSPQQLHRFCKMHLGDTPSNLRNNKEEVSAHL